MNSDEMTDVIHFRPFRNGDPPALAAIWNRGVPEYGAARPLSGHEFDAHVIQKTYFEADGLIVAAREGRIVGFAHAGFGPDDPAGPPHHLDRALGTVAMLVVEPGPEDPELERGLIAGVESYLRRRGSTVLFAGGLFPLNPFYWGIYGGSEWAGILQAHDAFHRAVRRAGYMPMSTTVLLEADLSAPEARDPRSTLIRRQARVEITEDALPSHWWEALAIGEFRPTRYRLVAKSDATELARATTWDMSWFGRLDGRARIGLIAVEVAAGHRRKGFGRHLVNEILRQARGQMVAAVAVQTSSTNLPALALYESLGFRRVEETTLYRLPSEPAGRAR
ncbi:MAG TPA: GNAT family N-acetyltransferase [Isosphaeraceae bacterium]|nr:GNAT family N-acetyltransferase [Isosphaeraceae bacterium]